MVEAYGLDPANVQVATTAGINVAIILDRAEDPTSLLSQDWGTRQQTWPSSRPRARCGTPTAPTRRSTTPWCAELTGTYGLTVLDGSTPNGNYVSSAESRTIWVSIDTPEQFEQLFGKTLFDSNNAGNDFLFWNGNLSLPSEWNVQGLWFDTQNAPPPVQHGTRHLGHPAPGTAEHRQRDGHAAEHVAAGHRRALQLPADRAGRRHGHDRPDRAGHRQSP